MCRNNLQRAFAGIAAVAPSPLGRYPSNFIAPNHTHGTAHHGIVIEGVMTNPFGAKNLTKAPRSAAGSHWHVPAGEAHAIACVSYRV